MSLVTGVCFPPGTVSCYLPLLTPGQPTCELPGILLAPPPILPRGTGITDACYYAQYHTGSRDPNSDPHLSAWSLNHLLGPREGFCWPVSCCLLG